MGTLTIRNMNDSVKERLRVRAASRGHSMEEEARVILTQAMGGVSGAALWNLSRELFADEKGVELALPSRADSRPSPEFSDH